MDEVLQIKPYARLITMLGDQLIKNELIALIELIKNSYDADASWVKVSFVDFQPDYSLTKTSKIVIEDDGCGMNEEILRKHWLNPATPQKLNQKKENEKTQKGRILQGEKGIGRFAIFKLGKKIQITTRRQEKNSSCRFTYGGEHVENTLIYDFSKYDDNFLEEDGEEKELYLEDLEVILSKSKPSRIVEKEMILGATKRVRKPHGTIIEICDLKTKWTKFKVSQIQKEIGKLQPIFSDINDSDFSVWIYKDYLLEENQDEYRKRLINCLNNKSVFKVTNGKYCSSDNQIKFMLNPDFR